MGSRSLWLIGSSRHFQLSCRWRRLSLLANSTLRHCIEVVQINSCILWRCSHNGAHWCRRNLLFWRRLLWLTRVRRHSSNATRCGSLSFHACAQKDRKSLRLHNYLAGLRRFPFHGSFKRRFCLCLGRSEFWVTWFGRHQRTSQKQWAQTISALPHKSAGFSQQEDCCHLLRWNSHLMSYWLRPSLLVRSQRMWTARLICERLWEKETRIFRRGNFSTNH